MSDGNQKARDSVAEFLSQLQRDNKFTKDDLQKAITYHESFVLELQGYKDIHEYSQREPGKNNTNDNTNLQKELTDTRCELDKVCQKYGKTVKEFEASEKEHIKLKDEFEKLKLEHNKIVKDFDVIKNANGILEVEKCVAPKEQENQRETFERQGTSLGKNTTNDNTNPNLQRELTDTRCELDKVCRKHEMTVQEFEAFKKEHSKLKDDFEKLKLEHNKIVKDYEVTKNANRNLELEKCVAPKEQESQKETELERQGTSGIGHDKGSMKEDSLTQEQGQSKAFEKLKQQNQQLSDDKKKLVVQISELRNRLSVMAGHKLTDGNPQIADLSDAFRPTKIAEQFRQLYDDEWTHAYEELDVNFKKEEEIIDILANIIKELDNFCTRAGSQQLEHLMYHAKRIIRDPEYQPDEKFEKGDRSLKWRNAAPMTRAQEDLANKLLKDFRKSLGIISKTPLLMIFRQVSPLIRDKLENISAKGLDDFLEKAFPLIWIMKMQDPVMEFVWSKRGDKFDKTMYSHYTQRGNTVRQCIWPAVVLHKAGPLMSKGVVQGN